MKDGGWEESRAGDNRIEIDKKQNGYTRNIVEMKQTRQAMMYGVKRGWQQTGNRLEIE